MAKKPQEFRIISPVRMISAEERNTVERAQRIMARRSGQGRASAAIEEIRSYALVSKHLPQEKIRNLRRELAQPHPEAIKKALRAAIAQISGRQRKK